MTLDRIKLSAQTVRDNIAILEECEEPDDAGYYLQLEHEKFVLSALEKQIPKKCKKFKDTCSCGYGVFPHMNFCSQCGQALDWSDTE